MSLATTGGGGGLGGAGGAGGLVMGHDASGSGAGALAGQPPQPPPTMGTTASGTATTSSSSTGPWVEVCDKTQRLTLSKAKQTAHYPLTAVDLHATNPTVAYFPSKQPPPSLVQLQEDKNNNKKKNKKKNNNKNLSTTTTTKMYPIFLGKMKSKLSFQVNEASHKALRKYLTATSQTPPSYASLKKDCLLLTTSTSSDPSSNTNSSSSSGSSTKDDASSSSVIVDRPHLWLGLRHVRQLPAFLRPHFPMDDDKNNNNKNNNTSDSSTIATKRYWWTDSTLDGSTPMQSPLDNNNNNVVDHDLQEQQSDFDMDRAVLKLKLHPNDKKKPLTILPEEATQLLLHQARSYVAMATKFTSSSSSSLTSSFSKDGPPPTPTTRTTTTNNNNNNNTDEDSPPPLDMVEEWTNFPMAIAVPSWALHDAASEALYEAASFTGPAGGPIQEEENIRNGTATGSNGGGVDPPPTLLFHRPICAVLGSMMKPDPYIKNNHNNNNNGKKATPNNPFTYRLQTVLQHLWKQHAMQHGRNAKETLFVAPTLVVTVGMTPEGCEVTALQLSHPLEPDGHYNEEYDDDNNEEDNVVDKYCLYEEYQVLANVGKLLSTMNNNNKPWQLLESCLDELENVLNILAPDDSMTFGPAVVLIYGSTPEQEALQQSLTSIFKKRSSSRPDDDNNNNTLNEKKKESQQEQQQSYPHWLAKVPVFQASPEAVSTGAALLGGNALGRVHNPYSSGSGGGGRKSLPLRVKSIATVSTGIARYYTPKQRQDHLQQLTRLQRRRQQEQEHKEGGADKDNNDDDDDVINSVNKQIKVVFDFDRRLPAGPYAMEFKASECVVHQRRLEQQRQQQQQDDDKKKKKQKQVNGHNDTSHSPYNNNNDSSFYYYSPEDAEQGDGFWKKVKEAESSKYIPQREKAALDFTIQIFQKYTRDGIWYPVGNPMSPLVKLDTQVHETDTGEIEDNIEETKIACEQVTLELSLAVMGVLTTGWSGERESVVQAMKTARTRLMEYYGWLTFAILFFGGFFIKSYYEDYVWKRDTQRLLLYYDIVIPGSSQDGDIDTARWLAYKYRHNKDKLWHNLEMKYGVSVPKEWPSSKFHDQQQRQQQEEDENDDTTTTTTQEETTILKTWEEAMEEKFQKEEQEEMKRNNQKEEEINLDKEENDNDEKQEEDSPPAGSEQGQEEETIVNHNNIKKEENPTTTTTTTTTTLNDKQEEEKEKEEQSQSHQEPLEENNNNMEEPDL